MKYKNKGSFLIFCVVLIVQSAVFAESNFNDGFNQGINAAIAHQGQSYNALQDFHPENYINNYNSNPNETNYLNNLNQLNNDASTAKDQSFIGQTIAEGMDSRTSQFNYSIDPASPSIQHIQKKADDVYDVVTGQFGDCTKQTSCTTNYETKVCEETPKSSLQHCRKTLNIDLVPHEVEVHYYLNARLTVRDHAYAGINVNVVNGNINYIGPHDADFSLDGRLPTDIDCHSLSGKVVERDGEATLDYVNFPSCGNGFALDFHISKGQSINLKIDMVSTKMVYEPIDRWQDDCTLLENSKTCSLQDEHCISSESTKTFQGIPVTRACWEKEASFICGRGADSQSCDIYREKGCEQINSICKNHDDSGCTLYQQTFQCPTKQCTDVGTICNGQTYCLSDDCIKRQNQPDADFQKSVAGLSVVNAAAKNYSENNGDQFSIFSGHVKTCNKDFLNYANCCSDNGWGIDFNLTKCDPESIELGEAKKNGLTSYIDSDDNCILGLCSHKKRYCVFPSKLARIVQENGRRDQLHVSFGNYNHPDCRGLTPNEFASLNLKQIDFSEIYAEITNKVTVEDSTKLKDRINSKIDVWSREKMPHG